jgi:hypothetical protein
MNFRKLHLCCECGRTPSRLKGVGLTAQHQLVIHWRCFECGRDVFVVKDLADCWRDCPQSDNLVEPSGLTTEVSLQREDENFLHAMGIKL